MIENLNKRLKYKNDIKGLQYVSLEILKEFDKICRKNNIQYWITDGTLLGAIRHKGFIPWDDDIDISIKAEDKEKLNKILKKKLPYFLYLTNDSPKNEKMSIYKIRDRYSTALEFEEEKRQTGIWIDIFSMTSIKDNRVISFITKLIPDVENNKNDNFIKKIVRSFIYKLLKIFKFRSRNDVVEKFFKILTEKRESEKNSVIYMEGKEWWHTYKKEWIFPLREIEFEGYKFWAPNKPEEYLKSYYGKNYMELPPENKRMTHCIGIDLFNSNNHPESLKWNEREEHIKKYLSKSEENEK